MGKNQKSKSTDSFWQKLTKAVGIQFTLGLFFVSALMVLLVSVVVNIHVNHYVAMITESTQNHLKTAAQAAAQYVSAEELDRYHTVEDSKTQSYQELKNRLVQFASKYNVKYVSYLRQYDKDNFQYIIDNDFDLKTIVTTGTILPIEDIARSALAGNVTATDLGKYNESWDGLLAGFAPVYDEKGNFYCVADVDISDEVILNQRRYSRTMMILQILALSISVLFGIMNSLLYRSKAQQIEEANVKLQYFNNNMRQAFSTYLSEDVVEEIISDPARLQLGGVNRHMTALFSDIKGFTGIAEKLNPEHLVDLLNHYLSTMSDIILEEKGTIDKYQGDAIVSFFGAPLELDDHALRACTAGIIMKRMEKDINKYVLEKGISPSPLLTRIGINTGDMVVGNMGTQKKMNYTIISNAVNMASRLEGVNKQYETWVLATDSTIQETRGKLLTRRLDRVKVVGINEAVRIHEILELKSDATDALFEQIYLFHKALDIFEERNWKDAEAAFTQVLKLYPNDGPSHLYLERCRQYQEFPPAADWDGSFNLTEK
ncbi:MAG: adenylate/guanylate cyclase domain-containing protein [Treponema sp.]|jgi:class 3 adenylate cyclase|nr:adenylate/guanylate cyclase domain-containing protein [Treponema sp.]